ncbi:SAM-dependent methyltransferase [Kribbella kalugense]|uniref:23S rRNA (Cytidine2498-2'-O)-methyltransferase n=1 Tax=Kribbella kalugense TaxID=2512221 RepID=A0A4R7ZC18_9ACTN|nr:SAM-dependent methyltransferase [Kribbella kalugense]TDW14376.1 23S rRNA (cytidine2498-2'-O)-methyltransferase [Kribbella kalugense]
MPRSVLFSFASDSYRYAVREIREAFPGEHRFERLGAEVARLADTAVPVEEFAAACDEGRIMFVRHLTREIAGYPLDDLPTESELATTLLEEISAKSVAVQTWVDGTGSSYHHLIVDALASRGVTSTRSGQDVVVSGVVAGKQLVIGVNRLADSLSDWPGGRMRLARGDERVSRSEFKLEEAIATFGLELPAAGKAVDLGASPGGWTRILRQHGQEVWSVDPGSLDPRLRGDRRIHHEATTAGRFFAANRVRFDVVVNDMRMDQELSARMMLDAAGHLASGGLAVVTLKGGGKNPLDGARRGLDVLRQGYDVLHARQLHHNRNEITVVARKH